MNLFKTCILSLLLASLAWAHDRLSILEQFSRGNFEIPALDPSQKRIILQFGDPGFDGGDVLENYATYNLERDALIVNITNLYKPQQKAALLACVAERTGHPDVHFCPACGCYTDEGDNFDKLYPTWPKEAFGDPTYKNPPLSEANPENYKGVYNEQLEGYKAVFGEDKICPDKYSEQDVIIYLKKLVKPFGENYVFEIFLSGPTTDLAKVLADDELSSHIRVIRGLMGGGFNSFHPQKQTRLGYNFVLDINSTNIMLRQIEALQIPTVVVSSQTCSTIPIQKEDFLAFMNSPKKTLLGQAFAIGWEKWNQHMSLKKKTAVIDFNIPDLVTVMLSYYSQHVGEVIRGTYKLHLYALEKGIHMLSPNAKELFEVVHDEKSPLFFVESINKSAEFYEILMNATLRQFVEKD